MEPMILARLIQALEVRPETKVIVGAATGYGSDYTPSSVIAAEARTNLVEKAQETLVEHGIDNAADNHALPDVYAAEAPYDWSC